MIAAMNLTPRQQEAYDAVCTHKPAALATIRSIMRCKPATAQQHLWALKNHGLIRAVGLGRHARWVPVQRPPAPVMRAIEQCPSVWEYAMRLQHGR